MSETCAGGSGLVGKWCFNSSERKDKIDPIYFRSHDGHPPKEPHPH